MPHGAFLEVRESGFSFSGPAMTRSIAASKSAIVTVLQPFLAAKIAASLAIFDKSAPTNPGVRLATVNKSTSMSNCMILLCNFRIAIRSVRSGLSTTICRSNRPARNKALSSISGRLVAAMTTTPDVGRNRPSRSIAD